MNKPDFRLCENKAQISFAITVKLNNSAFVFATWIVQFLFFFKSEISSLWSLSMTIQAVFCQTWSETPKAGFLMLRLTLDATRLNLLDLKY